MTTDEQDALIAAYKSGQVPESAWTEHLRDKELYARYMQTFQLGRATANAPYGD